MRATIKDVARLAGVSTATVSNVLTGRKVVSQELKERVTEAMKHLEYKPNSIARSLKTNQSHTIGVIVPDILNPFFAEVLKNIGQQVSMQDYQMVMYDSGESVKKEKKLLNLLLNSEVDGIIDITSRLDREEFKNEFPVPLVLGDRFAFPASRQVAFVHADNVAGGRMAAAHLIERGYEHFVCIAGPVDTASAARRRLEGFKEELERLGVSKYNLQIYTCSFSFDDGYQKMSEFLDTYEPGKQYAVYAASDIMAWGAVESCKSRNIRIPEDIAIIGNDNIWCSKYIAQGLTTIENSAHELGEQTAGLLLEALAGGGVFRQHEIILKPKLCQRTTT